MIITVRRTMRVHAVFCVESDLTTALFPEAPGVREEETSIKKSEKRDPRGARLRTKKQRRKQRVTMTEDEAVQGSREGSEEGSDDDDYTLMTEEQAEKHKDKVYAEMEDFIIGDIDVDYERMQTVPRRLAELILDPLYAVDPDEEKEDEEEEEEDEEEEEEEEDEETTVAISEANLAFYHRALNEGAKRNTRSSAAKEVTSLNMRVRYYQDVIDDIDKKHGGEVAFIAQHTVFDEQAKRLQEDMEKLAVKEMDRMKVPKKNRTVLQGTTHGSLHSFVASSVSVAIMHAR